VKVLLDRSTKRPSDKPSKLGQIISFIGVKGGVGTTTLAINTAAGISQLVEGGKVALAEMRPGQGSVSLMLGFTRPQALGDLLSKGYSGLTVRDIEGELAHHSSGVYLLMSAPSPDEKEADYSPEAAETLVRALAASMDYVVLDLGSGLSPENKRLATISEQVVICLEPQRVAVAQAQQMLQVFNELGLGPARTNAVLINRAPSGMQTSWQSVQQDLQKELLGIISPAPELAFQALEARTSMVQLQPDSITSGQFRKLGEALIGPVAE
jgi:pilus assembly protein CpaE